MLKPFLQTLKQGQNYLEIWPMTKKLAPIFPEYRVILATKLAIQVMPALAVSTLAFSVYLLGWHTFPTALASALFFLSLPIQGLYWLGWRATHPLPLTLLDWGNQLTQQLLQQGIACPALNAKACYLDIATILKLAFDKLEKQYWEQL